MASTKKKKPVSIQRYRERQKKPTHIPSDQNLLILLLDTAKSDPKRTAILGSQSEHYKSISHGDFLDRIEQVANGLRRLKIRKGDRVALLSENRPEWSVADFSIMALGAITVPVYNTLSRQQMAYQLKHSQAKLIFVSNGPHLETLRSIRQKLPHLKRLVILDDKLPQGFNEPDMTLTDLMALGTSDRRPIEILASQIAPEDPATIVYTTGTGSQRQKGILLTHKNFLAEKKALEQIFPIQKGNVLLSFLPLAHILQRVVDIITLLGEGHLAYCPDIDQVQKKLQEIRPHFLVGVPRTYEKIQDTIMENLFYSGPPFKEIYQLLFQWMERGHRLEKKGKKGSAAIELPLQWLKNSAVKKIRERLGGRIRSCFCAGAPLPKDLETFFEIIQTPLFNVYGMTELTGAVTANYPNRHRSGTVGIPLPGCEVRISEDSEVLVRGDVVMTGYYRPSKPPQKATNAEGWFATGDLGRLDKDGFLFITGRKKEILITAAGKNIAPQPIERKLRLNPYIKQAMVVGDGRKYLTALIVPSFSKLNSFAQKERILYLNHEELLEHPKVNKLFKETVSAANKDLSRFETLKKFFLVSEPFTRESGELTPTLRLRRKVIEKRYKDKIETLYWGSR